MSDCRRQYVVLDAGAILTIFQGEASTPAIHAQYAQSRWWRAERDQRAWVPNM